MPLTPSICNKTGGSLLLILPLLLRLSLLYVLANSEDTRSGDEGEA